VLVAVSSVGVVEMPADHVVDVVRVGHGAVAAAELVAMRSVVRPAGETGSASDRVCGADPHHVLVHVIAVDMMQVAIVQIVGVAVVSDVFWHGRGILLIGRAPPVAARTVIATL
jgi:hypothetical protein